MHPILATAHDVVKTEAQGLAALCHALTPAIVDAVNLLKGCTGRVIFSGMGKSGHIAGKLAATMASTGTPAFSIHPGEASHGDLGMVSACDVLVLLSNSGNSAELSDLIAYARRTDIPVIGISKNAKSRVGEAATVFLGLPDVEEACALHLAPTTSTTMTLALGDALCIALMQEKGFGPADFHRFHPGGTLGLDLLTVAELMRPRDKVPTCEVDAPMEAVLETINQGGLGLVVLTENGRLTGLMTDGDVRRHSHAPLIEQAPRNLMSPDPISVRQDELAVEALEVMKDHRVTALIVRQAGRFVGLLHIHELLRAGLS